MTYVLTYLMQTGRGRREAVSAEHAVIEYQRLELAGASGITIVGPHGPIAFAELLAAQVPSPDPAMEREENRIRRMLRWRFNRLLRH